MERWRILFIIGFIVFGVAIIWYILGTALTHSTGGINYSSFPLMGCWVKYSLTIISPTVYTKMEFRVENIGYVEQISSVSETPAIVNATLTQIFNGQEVTDWYTFKINNRRVVDSSRPGSLQHWGWWIDPNVEVGEVLTIHDERTGIPPFTVVGQQTINVLGRFLDVWELISIGSELQNDTHIYDKETGILLRGRSEGRPTSGGAELVLIDTNIFERNTCQQLS